MPDASIGQSTPEFKGYLPVPNKDIGDIGDITQLLKKEVKGGPTGTGRQTYYDDSVASSGTQQKEAATSTTDLDSVPPPDDVNSSTKSTSTTSTTSSTSTASTTPIAGPSGGGNPFLAVNPLVAFFMDFNEIANILRQMTNAQANLAIIEMGITNDLAHGEAQQIILAAKAESKMYMAAAISSFTEAGVSLATGLGSFAAETRADSQMSEASAAKKQNVQDAEVDTAQKKQQMEEAQNAYKAEASVPDKQAEVRSAREKVKQVEEDPTSSPNEINKAKKNLQQKQRELEAAKQADKDNASVAAKKKEMERTETDYEESQSRLNKAQREKQEFDAKFMETRYGLGQNRTLQIQMAGQFLSKSVDGVANLIKSIETMKKGQAEAIRALYQAYEQNALKQIDALNSAKSENSKMISELFQLLRKFSDDERKLGGSLTAQSV